MSAMEEAAVYDPNYRGKVLPNSKSCFVTTESELSSCGHQFVLGFKFNESVFMHAITHVADV